MNNETTKRNKRVYLAHLIWALPLICIAWFFADMYYRTDIDKTTSAKPQANELMSYIQQSKGSVLHTYNRSAGGFLNKVTSPSYELYIDYSDTNIENRTKEATNYLAQIGYQTKYAKYTYANNCSEYQYSYSESAAGENSIEGLVFEQCKALMGIDDMRLRGATENAKQPYYTIYGERGKEIVFVQISDKTFDITSNDSWREEYSEKYNIGNELVREGHSMMVVKFERVD